MDFIRVFELTILLIIVCIFILIIQTKKSKAVILVLTLSIIVILLYFIYFLDVDINREVDLIFNTINQHDNSHGNVSLSSLPLPEKTIYLYRTSGTSAVYLTKCNINEISLFYKDLSSPKESFSRWDYNDETHLELTYGSILFKLVISNYEYKQERWVISIDMIKNDL